MLILLGDDCLMFAIAIAPEGFLVGSAVKNLPAMQETWV